MEVILINIVYAVAIGMAIAHGAPTWAWMALIAADIVGNAVGAILVSG